MKMYIKVVRLVSNLFISLYKKKTFKKKILSSEKKKCCGRESLSLTGHSEVTALAKKETLISANNIKKKKIHTSIVIKKTYYLFSCVQET